MLKPEQIKIIDDYVNKDFFDVEKLKKYLNLHEIVGNEVFDYVDRKNRELNRKDAHDMIIIGLEKCQDLNPWYLFLNGICIWKSHIKEMVQF